MQCAAVTTHFLLISAPPQNLSPRSPTSEIILYSVCLKFKKKYTMKHYNYKDV